jgi:hypothetical protein
MNASNPNAWAFAIALAVAAPGATAQVFYQGFNICELQATPTPDCYSSPTAGGPGTYSFPAGWSLRNVDNRTPNAQVSYVNEAWEVREDFALDVTNNVAFSTSYYSPAGQADDWMWTPAITLPSGHSALTWRARAYDSSFPDGYEVRVMVGVAPTGGTGVIGNQLANSTQVFSVAHESTNWAPHSIPLDVYAGQTIHVGFRNNSVDQFLLVVDDVTVVNANPDVVAMPGTPAFASQYSRAPAGFIIDAALGFSAYNGGAVALTNVIGSAQYQLDGAPAGALISTTTIPTLAVGASAPALFAGNHDFAGDGAWSVQYSVSAAESGSEINVANNMIVAGGPIIGGNEFARAEGAPTAPVGIGAGNGGEIGEQFTLPASTTIVGIRFGMLAQDATVDDGMGGTKPNPFIGAPLVANLRAYDNTTPPGKPGALIASTVAVAATTQGGVYDVAFSTGPQILSAGTYVVTVSEPVQSESMTLPLHTDRFAAGTSWVNWPTAPTGDWAYLETFGASFAKTPEISMLTELSIFKDGFGLSGGNRRAGVQSREPLPLAPARPTRKATPTQLGTRSG